jgi:hypothetical protein
MKDNDLYKKLAAEPVFEIESELSLDLEKFLNSAIESNLRMTYESRIESHENARHLLVDLREAGDNLRARSQSSS